MTHQQKTNAENDPGIRYHMLYSEQWGQPRLKHLTTDRKEAHRLARHYMLNISPDSMPALLATEDQPWDRLMDDQTWNALAADIEYHQNMLQLVSGDDVADPQYHVTPPDLPPIVAKKRDKLLRAIGHHEDLTTRRELTEIIMAAQHRRMVNHAMFRESSLSAPTWNAQLQNACIQRLEHSLDELTTRLADSKSHQGSAIERLRLIAEREEAECMFYDLAEHEPAALLACN